MERRSKVPHGCVHAVVTRELNYVSRGWQQQMHAAGVLQEQPPPSLSLFLPLSAFLPLDVHTARVLTLRFVLACAVAARFPFPHLTLSQ